MNNELWGKVESILLDVRKPARYIGEEWNAIIKGHNQVKVKIVLAVPEIYELGMSQLGIKIIYGILNKDKDILCERVFSPWTDMQEKMREKKIPLFSLETKTPVNEFDLLCFSLSYEMTYTNMLDILYLSGIGIWADKRAEKEPLVIAGGICCFNPEPIADFIDLFVIGEGEEVVVELMNKYKQFKDRLSRKALLKKLSEIEGIYVPCLYDIKYFDDGRIKRGVDKRISKRIVNDFDNAYYPEKPPVPYINVIHDRMSIEVMRGCPHKCNFCQASVLYHPLRIRKSDTVIRLVKETYKNTGYEEISLMSLSTGDYAYLNEVVSELKDYFTGKAVGISLSSLRITQKTMNNISGWLDMLYPYSNSTSSSTSYKKGLKEIMQKAAKFKKTGLTFAIEAGSCRLRNIIGKDVNIDALNTFLIEAYKSGWRSIKLYFMIGLPGEEMQDIDEIIIRAKELSDLRNRVAKCGASVKCSIACFVPKAHTAFQWNGMAGLDELEKKQLYLKDYIRNKKIRNIKINYHNKQLSYIEGIMSRGDRKLSRVIYKAWENGAKFDGWDEHFKFDVWLDAFEKTGINPDFYTTRKRAYDEILPWDFIDIGIEKEELIKRSNKY